VDGGNPAPVDRRFIPLFVGFPPSKVVQDFFHPQYHISRTDLNPTERTRPHLYVPGSVRSISVLPGTAGWAQIHVGQATWKASGKQMYIMLNMG